MSTSTNIKDSSDNINWLEKSAEKGDEGSMHNLALRYYNGEGTAKDLGMAFH
ncbi:hypothetical protein C1646_762405, partial [Rhizophagus diaphanus]